MNNLIRELSKWDKCKAFFKETHLSSFSKKVTYSVDTNSFNIASCT